MQPQIALDQTIKNFKLKAIDICRVAGVDTSDFSKYRHGRRDIGSVTIFKIVDALPTEAKIYFVFLCFFSGDSGCSGCLPPQWSKN